MGTVEREEWCNRLLILKNGLLMYMSHTSKWQFGVQCHVFWRLLVTIENYVLSTKLIIIFIIVLGIWVIRASGNLGCSVTFFDSCRLLQKMMIFQPNLLQFLSLSLVYESYKQVAM